MSLLPPFPSLWIIQSRYAQHRKEEERFGHKPRHKENICNTLSNGFSRSHIWMWELDHKKGWALKNWCFWTVMLDKTLESPLDCKEIKPVNPKGNQLWIFTGRTGVEVEAPILWPPDAKSRLIGKDPVAGKDWRQVEKGMTEDEISWMASLTWWTWVWTHSRSSWWTGKPGMLQSMRWQRVGLNWVTEQTELDFLHCCRDWGKIILIK